MATPERPLHLGIIGLSATGSWASHAHLPYLQSSIGRRSYTIAGVCNSTLASSSAAISAHNLDASTCKPFASASALASDPSIDMIVVAVKAPLHHAMTVPILAHNAGVAPAQRKKIFVEYPLGASLSESRDLLARARDAGMAASELLVGLEEPFDACMRRVRELVVRDARIGKLVHVAFDIAGYPLAGRVLASREYALQAANGAAWNASSHLLNAIAFACGRSFQACAVHEANVLPAVEIVDDGGDSYARAHGEVLRVVRKDISDHSVFRGCFEKLDGDGDGDRPQLVGQQRTDAKWPGEPMVLLRIMGQKGQVRVSVPQALAAEFDDGTTVELLDYATGEVETVPWRRGEEDADEKVLEGLPGPARSIGRTYEAFANGKHVGLADWETGVRWHEFVNSVRGL